SVVLNFSEKIDALSEKLEKSASKCFQIYENLISSYSLKLDSLSPLKIMAKGYCIAADMNEFTISSASKIKKGEKFSLTFSDGRVSCTADEIELKTQTNDT
ncbi:MAG: exodeoxyribonuclease VII large subunit, partial [Acutalibacteraceae bacterium]